MNVFLQGVHQFKYLISTHPQYSCRLQHMYYNTYIVMYTLHMNVFLQGINMYTSSSTLAHSHNTVVDYNT